MHRIRSWLGYFHLLVEVEQRRAVLLDTGLAFELGSLKARMRHLDLEWSDLKAILLTHGHLDHTGNLAQLRRLTSAPVCAHPLEQPHIEGRYPYRGVARGCGLMEAVGRAVLRYQPAPIDQPLHDGEELPFWGGLEVVHLPGHTAGHCGFLSRRFDLLFCGDLFASFRHSTHLPAPILNSCPELLPASLERVVKLAPRLIVPNHYNQFDHVRHRAAFDRLAQHELRRR